MRNLRRGAPMFARASAQSRANAPFSTPRRFLRRRASKPRSTVLLTITTTITVTAMSYSFRKCHRHAPPRRSFPPRSPLSRNRRAPAACRSKRGRARCTLYPFNSSSATSMRRTRKSICVSGVVVAGTWPRQSQTLARLLTVRLRYSNRTGKALHERHLRLRTTRPS
jgi:hypothetical protein